MVNNNNRKRNGNSEEESPLSFGEVMELAPEPKESFGRRVGGTVTSGLAAVGQPVVTAVEERLAERKEDKRRLKEIKARAKEAGREERFKLKEERLTERELMFARAGGRPKFAAKKVGGAAKGLFGFAAEGIRKSAAQSRKQSLTESTFRRKLEREREAAFFRAETKVLKKQKREAPSGGGGLLGGGNFFNPFLQAGSSEQKLSGMTFLTPSESMSGPTLTRRPSKKKRKTAPKKKSTKRKKRRKRRN